MTVLRRLGDVLLTIAAVVGVLGLLLFVGVRLGAVQPLVVTSGSMHPAYEPGDLVISRTVDADDLRPGDVATLRDARGRLITHRVVSVAAAQDATPGTVAVVMQGDANDTADPQPYVVRSALVPVVRIPAMGPVVSTVQRPAVGIPALVAVAALVAMAFVPTGTRAPAAPGPGGEPGTSSTAARARRQRTT